MKGFAHSYSDKTTDYVLQNRKYKKSTIAFLERCLNYMGIKNGLAKYLSPLSEYAVPVMEELYEFA